MAGGRGCAPVTAPGAGGRAWGPPRLHGEEGLQVPLLGPPAPSSGGRPFPICSVTWEPCVGLESSGQPGVLLAGGGLREEAQVGGQGGEPWQGAEAAGGQSPGLR